MTGYNASTVILTRLKRQKNGKLVDSNVWFESLHYKLPPPSSPQGLYNNSMVILAVIGSDGKCTQ
jgi:hypothetical protein